MWLRFVRFPLVRLLLLGTVIFFTLGNSNRLMEEFADRSLATIAVAAGMAGLGLVLYYVFVRWVEGRPVSELALPPLARELGIGVLIGAGLYTACVLILMVMGIYRVEGLNPVSYMVPALAMALSAGFLEELLFRGVLFRIVEEWMGSWVALVVSSLVFGLVHLMNPAATWTGALFISVEAGVLLAAAYMLTRRLWLGIGFHVAWNYTQSAVFSGIVSGSDSEPGLLKSAIDGPALLTGGQFGLEASLVAFMLCTTTGVILLVMAVRRGNIVPPSWKRRREAGQWAATVPQA
jgi:membrane protease YdiL (CAAX protease family)